ncbi:MAG: zinc ribbon domain-containing protein [Nitrosarchaeum sp.]
MFGRKNEETQIEEKEQKQPETINVKEPFLIPNKEIPEKQMQDFIKMIEITRQETSNVPKAPILYQDIETGRILFFEVDICLPLKTKDEVTLWYRTKHEGVLNKKLRVFEAVTNYRVFYYDLTNPHPLTWSLSNGESVVVNNQRRYSTSQRQGSFAGFGARGIFAGSTGGTSLSQSETVGDVVLMSEGQIDFTFFGIEDPHGLAGLIKNVVKNRMDLVEKLRMQDANDKVPKVLNKDSINCEKCGSSNPNKSKFCNKCGAKLGSACTKCGAYNPDNSSFCNKCGFTLK